MFWVTQNPLEGTRWLTQLLQRAEDAPAALRAKALRALGGATTFIPGQVERGTKIYEESLAAYQAVGDERGIAILEIRLGEAALARGEFGEARRLFEDSLRLHRKVRVLKGQAQALSGIAAIEHEAGNGDRAMRLARESIEVFEEGGFPWLLAGGCRDMADYSLDARDFDSAAVYARRSLKLYRELGDRQSMVLALMLLAASADASGDAERAGRLWGGIEVEIAQRPVAFWETDRPRYEPKVLARPGSEFEHGLEEGRRLELDAVAEYALTAD
jgi:tetratricopeptide (TPR) repeat protein